MKKLLSLALALCMVFSLSLTAFAAGEETDATKEATVSFKKIYKSEGTTASSPKETFTFENVKCTGVVNGGVLADGNVVTATTAPAITVGTVEFAKGAATAAGAEGTVTINLPVYHAVGIYTYTFNEKNNSTAGVEYHAGDITLVVTVIEGTDGKLRVAAVHTENPVSSSNDENSKKTDEFTNTYSAGSLTVTKKVEGNMGDKKKEFQFTVTFTAPPEKTWVNEIALSEGNGAASMDQKGNVYTFTLADTDSITFENVPVGVTYTVDEADYSGDGYKTTGEVTEAVAMTKDAATVTVTNTKTGDIDTGITLDSMPYMMILAVVALSTVLFITKKRYTVE